MTRGNRLPDPALVVAALDALGEGVTIADRSGRIVYTNAMADRIVGVAPSEGPPDEWATHYGTFVPGVEPEPFPTDQYPLVRALNGEETNEVEMLIRNNATPEGALISITGRPVRDTDGTVIGAVVVYRDITRLREVETLSRLVPVCSWCRKVRSDGGYWQRLEAYIEASQRARVTHGMCPECELEWEQTDSRKGASG